MIILSLEQVLSKLLVELNFIPAFRKKLPGYVLELLKITH